MATDIIDLVHAFKASRTLKRTFKAAEQEIFGVVAPRLGKNGCFVKERSLHPWGKKLLHIFVPWEMQRDIAR
jgi:hypothetical protein